MLPGEIAAVSGGVAASHGLGGLPLMLAGVVSAAIIADTVGYGIGRKFGRRLLRMGIVRKRRGGLVRARRFLTRRGGVAVGVSRWITFFRSVMPAIAGASRMPYRQFVLYNAIGALSWSVFYVLAGYFGDFAYRAIEHSAGRSTALAVVLSISGAFL